MSIRPRPGAGVPELTARVARASNPAGTTAMRVRDRLDGLRADEDFASWYPRDGRPGISPARLATVSVLQFLLGLPDRDAAEAVRCRTGFTYALGPGLGDPGFRHSVLGDFRDRLLVDGRADRLRDLAPARLTEAGLVRERTAWRADSTRVLAAVRDLTRLELVTEAVRAAVEELARTAGHVLEGLAGDDWGRRYGRPVRLGKNPTRPKTRINEAAADARRLPGHPAARHPGLLRGPRVRALRQILVQDYHWDPAGRLRGRDDEGGAGLPPPAARIVSPYDLAARYSRRGQVTRWTGYLAHVTETCADDGPNVITDVATMPAASSGTLALAGIHARPGPGPAARRAPGRRRLHLPGAQGAGRARAPGRPHRAAARQPHPPAPRPGGLRPRRLPRRLRPPGSHLPPGPGQQGVARPLPHVLAPTPPRSSWRASPRPSASPAPPGPPAPPPATASAPWASPRELYELQARNRADQQDPAW